MFKIFTKFMGWWFRRYRGELGIVVVRGGTTWIEHRPKTTIFSCHCGRSLGFGPQHLFIRERDPETHDVTDARYCMICPCGLGHWRQAETEEIAKPA